MMKQRYYTIYHPRTQRIAFVGKIDFLAKARETVAAMNQKTSYLRQFPYQVLVDYSLTDTQIYLYGAGAFCFLRSYHHPGGQSCPLCGEQIRFLR